MPYWSIHCVFCNGFIADALLECLPQAQHSTPAFHLLFSARPGAALACPYCNNLLGFDSAGQPQIAQSGWPVFRYGQAQLEAKKLADGEPATTPVAVWASRHRFMRPGSQQHLTNYTYAEQAPPNETVP
jgi:hypothetical protein